MSVIGHNQGPPLTDGLTLDEAQELPQVHLRPSHVQRYCGKKSPLRRIVGCGGHGIVGFMVLLECGHWRDVFNLDIRIMLGQRRPESARCGLCRLGYVPDGNDKQNADALMRKHGKEPFQ